MKPYQQHASYGISLKQTLQIFQSFAKPPCLVLAALLLYTASAPAATLTWDAGNTNNGATIDSASGFWDVTHLTTNLVAATTTTATNNVNLGAGGMDWFQVNVPANAVAATNTLLFATNLPVNVWFSLTQTTNNAGDTLLMAGVTSGVSVLTTNLASAPTNIVQGGTYFIGIDNSANGVAVGYALEVVLLLTNAVTITSTNLDWNTGSGNVNWTQTGTTTPLNGTTFNGPDAPDGTYQVKVDNGQVAVTNITINANGYAFSGSPIFLNRGGTGTFAYTIADGKSVVISNNFAGAGGNQEFILGSNGAPSTTVLYGALSGFTPIITSTNGSIFYLAGGGSAAIGNLLADIRLTNGTYNSGAAFVIGRNGGSPTQPNNAYCSFTVDGPTTILNQGSDYIYLGRNTGSAGAPWDATLTIQNGATVNYQVNQINNNNLGLSLPRSGSSSANCKSRFNMYGGTLNMGPGTEAVPQPRPIRLNDAGSSAGQLAIMNQTGGVVNAWGGILVGGSTGSGSASLTNSGGFLYIGAIGGNGIKLGTSATATNRISLSGGTVGALQTWISSAPMTLATLNGNITFQCADANATPYNISLSGPLTGPGGFNKSGGGTLTLTGTNNYAGLTVVSNGILVVSTANSPITGDVIVDGSLAASGLPVVTNLVGNTGQSWIMTNLTFVAGTPTMAFNYGNNSLSTTVAPVQAKGNLAFTVTPSIDVFGAAIPVGTYPLIKYTGTLSGTPPTTILSLPPGVTAANIVNNTANKSIDLHVTGSINNPPLKWLVGNGTWDTNTPNWTQGGGPTLYTDDGTKDVKFDDSASGTSPIMITLNATLNNPKSVTGNNVTKAYVISGTGSIGGTAGLTVSGAGSLTLSNANTYSGGTTVTGPGQLNINYGGTGGSDSAIGTGTLNISAVANGAKLDNTSGHAVVLNTATPIPINWIDDWTFVGTTNLDLGLGQVTLGNVEVQLTVVSNTLTVNNPISDNGLVYKLTKFGNGALTLSNTSSAFTGGLDLEAGTLNINSDGCSGSGLLTLGGGVLDNTSGADVTLNSPSSVNMLANFTFKGTGKLIIAPNSGSGLINIGSAGSQVITLNGTNSLETDGAFLGGNRNTTVNGTGSWIMGGVGNNGGLSLNVNGGTVYFAKASGVAESNPIQISTNAAVVLVGATGTQITAGVGVTLNGGTLELAGDTEPFGTVTFNSGHLKNSAPTTASVLPTASVVLGGGSCVFDVTNADSSLTISNVTGSGGLILTGLGQLIITTNNYTGNTTISNGTLVLNFPTLGTNSTVTVNTNATLGTNGVLTLAFVNSETNVVAALVLGGVSKTNGVYNATTDPLYITGTGSLEVVALSTINPLPGPIHFSVSGSTLALSWPTNLGWILQDQTNALNVGLIANSNAWFDISNSASVTSTNITINPANPTVFFRLRHP